MSQTRSSAVLQLLRSLCHLVAVIAIGVWAFHAWPLPWPGILTGVGFVVLSVVVWALFLSPRPVLRTDRFGQAVIELLLIAAAVAALLALGVLWPVAVAFGVAAAVIGYFGSTAR